MVKVSAQMTESNNPNWNQGEKSLERSSPGKKMESVKKYDKDNLWNAKNKEYL